MLITTLCRLLLRRLGLSSGLLEDLRRRRSRGRGGLGGPVGLDEVALDPDGPESGATLLVLWPWCSFPYDTRSQSLWLWPSLLQRDPFPVVSWIVNLLRPTPCARLLEMAGLSLSTFPQTLWILLAFLRIHLIPLLAANAVLIQPTVLVCRSRMGGDLLTADVALDLASFRALAFVLRFSLPFVSASTRRCWLVVLLLLPRRCLGLLMSKGTCTI